MKNNLTARTVVIVVTLLLCVFGIIGFPKSGADSEEELQRQHPAGSRSEGRHATWFLKSRSRTRSRRMPTRPRTAQGRLKKQNIAWDSMDAPDVAKRGRRREGRDHHQRHSRRRNPAPFAVSDCRALSHLRPDRRSTPPITRMKLKPTDLNDLKRDTVKRAVDTIGNRIDQLGLAEKSVQQYGRPAPSTKCWCSCPAWTIRRARRN